MKKPEALRRSEIFKSELHLCIAFKNIQILRCYMHEQ
jgi:hypothetical protein